MWVRDALYYWKMTRADLKVALHALNYWMGQRRLSDILQQPSIKEFNTWEGEGGAL